MTILLRAPSRGRLPAVGRPFALPLVLAAVLCAACTPESDPRAGQAASGSPDATTKPADSPAETVTPSASSPSPSAAGTPITITLADAVITARLADNATARDLAAQLPLTLTFKDFNRVEKIAPLPRSLSMDGVPAGADPEIGDIGYYEPSGDLVFYYGEVGYFNGIVRIGRFNSTMEQIQRQDDGFRVIIDRR